MKFRIFRKSLIQNREADYKPRTLGVGKPLHGGSTKGIRNWELPKELDPMLQSPNVTAEVVIIEDEANVDMSEAIMDKDDATTEAEDLHFPRLVLCFLEI